MPRAGAPGESPGAPVVLAFETAGSACSVAIGRGAAVLAHERREMRHGHAEALLPMIDRVTEAAQVASGAIGIVAATVGPGGFTGIRAGLAAAHGLALALRARLVGVSSFAAVAALIPASRRSLLVALDSRRVDLYVQLFDSDRTPCGEPRAILPAELVAWIGGKRLAVAGDAAAAAAAAFDGGDVEIVPASAPDACGVLAAVHRWPERADPGARALYLRPPDVSFPRAGRGLL